MIFVLLFFSWTIVDDEWQWRACAQYLLMIAGSDLTMRLSRLWHSGRWHTHLFTLVGVVGGVLGVRLAATLALQHLAVSCTNDGRHNVTSRQLLVHACMRNDNGTTLTRALHLRYLLVMRREHSTILRTRNLREYLFSVCIWVLAVLLS